MKKLLSKLADIFTSNDTEHAIEKPVDRLPKQAFYFIAHHEGESKYLKLMISRTMFGNYLDKIMARDYDLLSKPELGQLTAQQTFKDLIVGFDVGFNAPSLCFGCLLGDSDDNIVFVTAGQIRTGKLGEHEMDYTITNVQRLNELSNYFLSIK
ncbi:hypothetical protein [Vibrio splendidus]|uniref:hypothetical protein n=1 Tax=Vibrio splendidus TaxID=29497 RepID=UPI0021B3FD9C|nr:hypothetical protein [Vibrio splendidus]UWZ99596.1 hypothetical protein IM698_21125 [Vibrio splendidus]